MHVHVNENASKGHIVFLKFVPTIRQAPCMCMLCATHTDCTCRVMRLKWDDGDNDCKRVGQGTNRVGTSDFS